MWAKYENRANGYKQLSDKNAIKSFNVHLENMENIKKREINQNADKENTDPEAQQAKDIPRNDVKYYSKKEKINSFEKPALIKLLKKLESPIKKPISVKKECRTCMYRRRIEEYLENAKKVQDFVSDFNENAVSSRRYLYSNKTNDKLSIGKIPNDLFLRSLEDGKLRNKNDSLSDNIGRKAIVDENSVASRPFQEYSKFNRTLLTGFNPVTPQSEIELQTSKRRSFSPPKDYAKDHSLSKSNERKFQSVKITPTISSPLPSPMTETEGCRLQSTHKEQQHAHRVSGMLPNFSANQTQNVVLPNDKQLYIEDWLSHGWSILSINT